MLKYAIPIPALYKLPFKGNFCNQVQDNEMNEAKKHEDFRYDFLVMIQ